MESDAKTTNPSEKKLYCGACGAVWNTCSCHPDTCEPGDIEACSETGVDDSQPSVDGKYWFVNIEGEDKLGSIPPDFE